MRTLALAAVAAFGLAAAPAMAQDDGTAGGSASGAGIGGLSTEALVFAGVAAAATVAVVSDSSSSPIVECTGPDCDENPGTTVTVTGTGTNTNTVTVPVQ